MKPSWLAGWLGAVVVLAQGCAPSPVSLTPSPIPSLPAPTIEPPPLISLTSERGRYAVQLPVSEGMLDYAVTYQILERSTECQVTFSRLDYAYAGVEYCDLDSDMVLGSAPQAVLERAMPDLTRPLRARVDDARPGPADVALSILTVFGRADTRGQGYDGSFEARMLLSGQRLYVVFMAATDGDLCACTSRMSQVVDSFHVEPDLSIPYEPAP